MRVQTMGIVKIMLIITGIGSLIFAAIPIVGYGFLNAGVVALCGLAAICFLQLYLLCQDGTERRPWEVFSGKGRAKRVLRRIIGVGLAVFIVAELALSAVMLGAVRHSSPVYTKPTTAVVLGCQIFDDQPSKMLQNRLEQALIYLNNLPTAKVVVTGGQGDVEKYAEADIEAKWLIEKGIAPERIIIENQSRNTYENMSNAAVMLAENGLAMEAVLFTDGFHQLRSQLYAGMSGIEATGIASSTPWGLLPSYWLREQMAICQAVLVSQGII